MAQIDIKFMKGDRTTAKKMGNTYTVGKKAAAKGKKVKKKK